MQQLEYPKNWLERAKPPLGFEPIQSQSPFAYYAGPIFEKRAKEGWIRGVRVLEHHLNAGGSVHGGMVMTFGDVLLARAVLDEARAPFVTVRLTTDFIGGAMLDAWVEGSATAIMIPDGLVSVEGLLKSEGAPIAVYSGLFKAFLRD